ncbi:MAG: hypothetical protein JWL77_4383 [Chthonomonadaceae bacterium]|nr:hypothetical protein [Chthonomonadaceae bacterium]
MTGMAHVFFGVMALILGGIVVFQPKGTQRHRKIGYAYVVSMLMLNGLSFLMYRFTGHFGHFGPFHILSVISLITLANGWMVAFFRRPAHLWLQIHLTWMGWSYIGLWAATATEIVVRLPFVQTPAIAFVSIIITTLCVTGLGGVLLFRYFRKSGFTFAPPIAKQSDAS